MVTITALWLPILLAAIVVFVVSSVIHMFLKYHQSDFRKLDAEDAVMNALRPFRIPPGDYVFPYCGSTKRMGEPDFIEKMAKGPIAFMTVMPNARPSMAASLIQWFVYCLIVGVFAAYVTGRALEPGAHYLSVFRLAGTVAFAGYGLALLQNSIWYKRNWPSTIKSVFDALIYALVTAGTFGWLWPA